MADFNAVLNAMVGAAQREFGQNWPQVQNLVTLALEDLARTTIEVEAEVLAGRADEESGRLVIKQAADAAEGAIAAAIVGLQVSAQKIVNETLAAVRGLINSAVRFPLLVG